MNKIASFEDFKKSKAAPSIKEEHGEEHGGDPQHYMFFQNLASIKHYIDEILKMEPEQVDNMLKNGHDWAADHIATSKDDIQEVAEWIRNEMENPGHEEESGDDELAEPEVDNIIVNIEGEDDDKEDEEEEDDDEDEDDDEEEEEEA
jgi:hypothetical protein